MLMNAFLTFVAAMIAADQRDFAKLARYRAENVAASENVSRPRIIFLGDSITERWSLINPNFFKAGMINRGISGQTTAQMLIRFRQDVIDLHPDIVHIMGGMNDIRGNGGIVSNLDIENNIKSMVELSKIHGIKIILGSITSATRDKERPNVDFPRRIIEVNIWLKQYSAEQGVEYADYWTAMESKTRKEKAGLTTGLHPTLAGYGIMDQIAGKSLQKILKKTGLK